MQTKFDIFLEQLHIKEKKGFENIIFHPVTLVKSESMWIFNVELDEPVSINDIRYLNEKINIFFNHKIIKKIKIKYQYKKITHGEYLIDYFNFILSELIKEKSSFQIIKNYNIRYFEQNLYLEVPKNQNVNSYIKEILNEFNDLGFKDLKILIEESKEIDIENIKKKKEDEHIEQILNSKPTIVKEVKIVSSKPKNDKVYTKISEIPQTSNDISRYQATVGEPIFNITGEIIKIELKQLPKSTLLILDVYDSTDTITVQQFLNKEVLIEEASKLKVSDIIQVRGMAVFDSYRKDVIFKASNITFLKNKEIVEKKDLALEKRVELHAHTKMSNIDGLTEPKDLIKKALQYNHKGIAITDKNGVYSFPDIYNATKGLDDFKVIYGTEFDYIDDQNQFRCTYYDTDFNLDDMTYVVYDLETTGFQIEYQEIIEIGAVKIKNGEIIDTFSEFVKPSKLISTKISELTNITNEMVEDAKPITDVLPRFRDFFNGCCLVGHNINFDNGFLFYNLNKLNINFNYNGVIDTLNIARSFYSSILKRYNLKDVSKAFKVKLSAHHRAVNDSDATANVFIVMLRDFKKMNILTYKDIDLNVNKQEIWKGMIPKHINVLALNETGLKNLFRLVSDSLTKHVHKGPRMFKSDILKYKEGLIVGSGCYKGEVFETAMNKTYKELLDVIDFYDYVEVQPPCGYAHLFENFDNPLKEIKEVIIKIINAAKEKGKIVVATSDTHYLEKEEQQYFDILVNIKQVGGGFHDLKKYEKLPDRHFFTTDEMLLEFQFLDQKLRQEIVIKNPNKILDMAEKYQVLKKELYAPGDDFLVDYNIDSVEEDLKRMVNENVHNKYGEVLPEIVSERVNKELNSIITNKFSTIYYMAHLLVKKSRDDGYVVGSRGSVGSSFVATMMNITEVNPLSPHYICPNCKFSSFKMNEEEKAKYKIRDIEKDLQKELDKVESGFDLPDKFCPCCNHKLLKDGHDIPFETFLGFKGDKVPDIDLNFSGDYQGNAHNYVKELMGEERAFRSGTISTIAENTAIGYVKGYLEEKGIMKRRAEISRLASHINGVKRTTGQHPGGIIVVPKYKEIYDVTPIQYPADDNSLEWRTTHFDYHKFEDNLLKLDILGHDDPTVLKFLMDYVNLHQDKFPFSTPYDIPIDDKEVYKLFCGLESINLKCEQIDSTVGSYAVPELGTTFVRKMLEDTKPKTFAELVKLSGLSHGTDVWTNNAKELVNGNKPEFGKIDIKKIIGCRDDIMVDLMYMGLEPSKAFEIMEFVRKGKPAKKTDPKKWADYKDYMQNKNVPSWYIWSCEQIQYMFPKAHATAYVLNAIRIAWFKVHAPLLFYSAYFSIRAAYYDIEAMVNGAKAIRNKIDEIKNHGDFKETDGSEDEALTPGAKKKDTDTVTVLYVALEMVERGYKFLKCDINKSDSKKFIIDEENKALIMPFVTIPGLGENAAIDIVEKRPFKSKKDLQKRAKVNKTVYDFMLNFGCLDSLVDEDEPDELNLFTFL